jgi:DeoR/GlpR family transcriptional regulator of sugar metabolism|tara:strand:- start:17 stop:391 length:375 start_codon:yes stop_codon:yes gene_type:complete
MGLLNKIFGGGGANLIGSIDSLVDNITTTKEEKLKIKKEMKALVEQEISKRWLYDTKYGNALTRSVRPLVLIFLIVCTMSLVFIDSGSITFEVQDKWTDLLQITLITVIGAYFGGRSVEKLKKL